MISAKGLFALIAFLISACTFAVSPSQAQSEPPTTGPLGLSHPQSTPTTTDPEEPAGFKIAYGLSFFFYDACGDSEVGRIARRAVLEKFNKCQFPQHVREKFRDFLIETLEEFATDAFEAAAQGKDITPTPDFLSPDGSITTCEDYRQTPSYRQKRDILLKYDRKEVSVDEVLVGDCALGPAAL